MGGRNETSKLGDAFLLLVEPLVGLPWILLVLKDCKFEAPQHIAYVLNPVLSRLKLLERLDYDLELLGAKNFLEQVDQVASTVDLHR